VLADLELLASHELVRFAGDLRNGRLSPRAVDPELFVQAEPMTPSTVLGDAAAAQDFERFLADLTPANPYYRRLRRVLADHRAVERQGGWPTLDAGSSLRQGDRDPRVRVLRERLSATRDITVPASDPSLFDAALDQAVRRFQARHGLEVDGIVGPNTRAALNTPVETRLQQIVVNMERWRWMSDDLGRRYILVNLAGFELDVVEDGRNVLNMRVVVGRPYRRTPVFTGRMTYLEFNPTWTVPPTIARVDILPKLREDPGYLAEENMLVYRGWDADARPLDPTIIDWRAVDPRRIPYRIVQQPGPKNALGRVKFMFPNRFHVYLHDTPSRELFERTVRTFSSGCIRIEKPLEMAEYLLDGDQGWTRERMEAVIAGGKRTAVPLPRPLPVYLTYSTVWVGEGGTVHFRNDVYGRDQLLSEALYARSQRAESL
jgi:murein L,D-transpeptidase YcbB/YkuD